MTALKERELSRLEETVLGFVFRGGPCTAYWIRREFQRSKSSYFSGSAGAVYPAVDRLEARGLIAGREQRNGKKRSRTYELTDAGHAQLAEWLRKPVAPDDLAYTYDPLRMRVFHLDALPRDEQLASVEATLAQVRNRKRVVEEDLESRRQTGEEFNYLGGLGALREAEARVRWLREVRDALKARQKE